MNLAGYRLLAQLGAGVDGNSYRAWDLARDCAVEVRTFAPAWSDQMRWQSLCKRLRLAAMLKDDGARSIRTLALEDDPPWIALEWAEEKTLGDASIPWSDHDVVRLGKQLAETLRAAHRLGLTHGELCPAGIGVTLAYAPRLEFVGADCGLAGGFALQQIGTGSCQAPELRKGQPVQPSADVYSLGAVLSWLRGKSHVENAGLEQLISIMESPDSSDRPTIAEVLDHLNSMHDAVSGSNEPATLLQPSQTMAYQTASPEDDNLNVTAGFADAASTGLVQEPTTAPGIASGSQLGRFRLLEKLGEGGLGQVFKAEDLADGSIAAIKILQTHLTHQSQALLRLKKEARLLQEVNNPYVANFIELNEDQGTHYMAIEYVAGISLGKLLERQSKIEEKQALEILAGVARALLEAHKRGIVHRDIKPDNIMLLADSLPVSNQANETIADATHTTYGSRVKLLDFGLARHVVESASLNLTRAGSILGTPYYLSPEQGSGKQVDARADVYSMGATLYHLLAGQPPFQADTVLGLIAKHCHEQAPPLHKINPAISEAVCQVVDKTLAKNPDDRYADAEAFLHELERLLRGEPVAIHIHPLSPIVEPGKLRQYDWTWELEATPEQLWPYVSNTDRLNRAVGLPAVKSSLEPTPDGRTRRIVEFRKMGIRAFWEEAPFEWVEGQRFGVLRLSEKGPFRWFMSVVELKPRPGGGTNLTHRVRLDPRGLFGKMVAALEIGFKGRRNVDRVYRRIDAFLTGKLAEPTGTDPFEKSPGLSRSGRRRLDNKLDQLSRLRVEPGVVEALGEFLTSASASEVARIRPLALARRLKFDPDQVVAACLHAAHQGLLVLLWDILCPICRIPSTIQETLKALRDHGHCQACNLDFQLDFANSVEMIFRIHPDIRESELATYCIGGPAHSPHVVAQVRVAPGERLALNLKLTEGAYRIRGPQLPFALDFHVEPLAGLRRWEIPLEAGLDPHLPHSLKTGQQELVFTNSHSQELLVRVERSASRTDCLTAARASTLALFRELFPGEILAPGQMIHVANITLLITRLNRVNEISDLHDDAQTFTVFSRHVQHVQALVAREGGALVKTVDNGILAAFTDPAAAVRAGLAVMDDSQQSPECALGIHRGPTLVTTLNDHLDYFGITVSQAVRVPQLAQGSELILSQEVASEPNVAQLLRARQLESAVFEATLPGHANGLFVRVGRNLPSLLGCRQSFHAQQ